MKVDEFPIKKSKKILERGGITYHGFGIESVKTRKKGKKTRKVFDSLNNIDMLDFKDYYDVHPNWYDHLIFNDIYQQNMEAIFPH